MGKFTHLHVHSQYSILDGAASIDGLISKAKELGMNALALTDHGNLMGLKDFHDKCLKNKIKPILGCETYVAKNSLTEKSDSVDKSGYHLILLAKNLTGYHNLIKMISVANLEGFYSKPRIDKKLLLEHKEGIIVSSACLGGEIPKLIASGQIDAAKETILWFKENFGDDFYLEVMHHPCNDPVQKREVSDVQELVNKKIFELSAELGVKVIATNDSHFINEEDAEAHDVLICLTTNADINDPNRLRYTKQEWLKSYDEMLELFPDHPEVLENTNEIADKVEIYDINRNPLMPEFPIPESFGTIEEWRSKFTEEDLKNEFTEEKYKILGGYGAVLRIKLEADYLRFLTEKGAIERYGENYSDDVKERIEYELLTIKRMGYPGYFLIVQDFIQKAREMGVLVGKGRGSAAGSVVAYCTKITDVDPLKFDLLFERFLNPDRISMPDVDIDFDDDGRAKVIEYVVNKYGKDKVAHICTIGTMKAKGAIKDVFRIMGIDLNFSNELTKKLDDKASLSNAYAIIEKEVESIGSYEKYFAKLDEEIKAARKEDDEKSAKLLDILETRKVIAETMQLADQKNDKKLKKALAIACVLEGSVRQTGVHACGMLIGRESLVNNIPLMRTKDGDLATTQYEGSFVEAIGLLKMDFLGLKTLSVIKDCIENIKLSKGIDFDIDSIDYDDQETYKIFKSGETTSIFQFESDGMKSSLRDLEPSNINDLIAMVALYRPGPMDYIPNYVARKKGKEKVVYDHPLMEKYLKETYGITIYQEQVMLLSRSLANFTRGESDTLRKAMGKKDMKTMEKLEAKFKEGCKNNPEFIEGCKQVNNDPDVLVEKIWKDWIAFANYAFNKSHSVCYAVLAYQTAYLKAHFPAEFMAAAMSRAKEIEKISELMEECRRMKIKVLSPDINESIKRFSVTKSGNIRFGLGGIKNLGSNAIENIIEERNKNGNYTDIFDFVSRVNLNAVNKKAMEALAYSGAFDSFKDIQRPQYFMPSDQNETFIESLIKFGNNIQQSKSSVNTLFGNMDISDTINYPKIPPPGDFNPIEFLDAEKEFIGMYVSSHPLDKYKFYLDFIHHKKLDEVEDILKKPGKINVIGFVLESSEKFSKEGKPYGTVKLLDYSGTYSFTFFGKDYAENKNFFTKGYSIMMTLNIRESKNSSRMFVGIESVKLLSDVKDECFKNLTLYLDVNNIDNIFVDEMIDLIMNKVEKGKIQLLLSICNNGDKPLKLVARKKNISLNDELIYFLQNNKNINRFSLS